MQSQQIAAKLNCGYLIKVLKHMLLVNWHINPDQPRIMRLTFLLYVQIHNIKYANKKSQHNNLSNKLQHVLAVEVST